MKKKVIIYDFDGTLTDTPVATYRILEKLGYPLGCEDPKFYAIFDSLRSDEDTLHKTWFKTLIKVLTESGMDIDDEKFGYGVERIVYNKGVEEFLDYFKNNNIVNIVLTSGEKNYLLKTKVAKYFEEIRGVVFSHDEKGVINGVEYELPFERKVDEIKDICNKYDVDIKDVIYIGDGMTDLFAMGYVKPNGGTTILINQPNNDETLQAAKEKDLVTYYSEADFSIGSDLFNYVKSLCEL